MSVEFPKDLQEAIRFHGHVCPGLVMGYRAAKAAQTFLQVEHPEDEELVAIAESDGCGVDAVQSLLGCTLGKGNLIYRDHGKQARALATAPDLLLADEPTSMLDASAGVGILNLLRELAMGGMTILVTIHDLATACYVADRILVLSEGAILEEGPPSDLLANARHDLTRRLIAAAGMRSLPPHGLSGREG